MTDECDLCELDEQGVMGIPTSMLEKYDITVCEAHLQLLREQGDSR